MFVSCCGFDLARNVRDAEELLPKQPALSQLKAYQNKQIFALDGNRYLARPGPGLLQATAIMAHCMWQHEPTCIAAIEATGLLPADMSRACQQVDVSVRSDADDDNNNISNANLQNANVSSRDCNSKASTTADVFAAAGVQASTLPDIEDVPSWVPIHQEACQKGDKFYQDPITGLTVMTELIHRERGRCCGNGCRHCPYSHENVPLRKRADKISQPAWLVPPGWTDPDNEEDDSYDEDDNGVTPQKAIVLFWSTGKDSYLTLRELHVQYGQDPGIELVLFTTFDGTSRRIGHQETDIEQAIAQAKALRAPLFGVPLQRGGQAYPEAVRSGLDVIRSAFPQGIAALAFGDLHLEHIRDWRENAGLHDASRGEQLLFPLWHRDYNLLMEDLERSGARCTVSAVTEPAQGIVSIGQMYNRPLYETALANQLDGFGEKGEFHTLVEPDSLAVL
eukprot:TRINITY_DN12453_c0_g1_i2.p2 TRINITY_DN12453_c0_g1~~TRINITY_DN12453_c0_g1_i2.p2  ORF type:complete len:450 (+),score=85.87 TRINITY_DN12453_c0_g1_i2:4179-5528(+)